MTRDAGHTLSIMPVSPWSPAPMVSRPWSPVTCEITFEAFIIINPNGGLKVHRSYGHEQRHVKNYIDALYNFADEEGDDPPCRCLCDDSHVKWLETKVNKFIEKIKQRERTHDNFNPKYVPRGGLTGYPPLDGVKNIKPKQKPVPAWADEELDKAVAFIPDKPPAPIPLR